jgi:hypothetical protein
MVRYTRQKSVKILKKHQNSQLAITTKLRVSFRKSEGQEQYGFSMWSRNTGGLKKTMLITTAWTYAEVDVGIER